MSTAPILREIPRASATPEIELTEYARITPGTYSAYCTKTSKPYWCRTYKRWQVVLYFDVLTATMQPLAKLVTFFALGKKQAGPKAHRTGKYLAAWVKANGGPPTRASRLSPSVFVRRMATIKVEDTNPKLSPAPYSIVREILNWESAPAKRPGLASLEGATHHNTTQPGGFSKRESAKGIE